MSSDLSVQTAASLASMKMQQTGQEISMKVMKMRLQQDQQLVALLMEQAKQIQTATASGGANAMLGGVDVRI